MVSLVVIHCFYQITNVILSVLGIYCLNIVWYGLAYLLRHSTRSYFVIPVHVYLLIWIISWYWHSHLPLQALAVMQRFNVFHHPSDQPQATACIRSILGLAGVGISKLIWYLTWEYHQNNNNNLPTNSTILNQYWSW